LGFCAALGTLLPATLKIFMPDLKAVEASVIEIAKTAPGQVTLAGIAVCLIGIGISALAGLTKEKEMSAADKQKSVAEFSFGKGLLVATFAGVMSACMSFGLTAASPIGKASLAAGTNELWTGLPKLCVVLLGGFTTNLVWCVYLNFKNRSGYQYVASHVRAEHSGLAATGDEHGGGTNSGNESADLKVPMLANYLFSALAGATWYFQFFFYTMGATQMGKFARDSTRRREGRGVWVEPELIRRTHSFSVDAFMPHPGVEIPPWQRTLLGAAAHVARLGARAFDLVDPA